MAAVRVQKVFSLPSILLAAVIESTLAPKLFPEHFGLDPQGHPGSRTALIFGVNLLVYLAFWALLYPYAISPLRHIQGPRDIIPLGYRIMLGKSKIPGDIYLDLDSRYPDEDILQTDLLRNRLIITKPRLIPDVLVHRSYDFEKPENSRNYLRQILGDGLVTVEGNVHKFLRKNTMPAFSFRHIKDLYPMMWAKSLDLADAIGAEMKTDATGARSNTIELTPWASRATMDIIGIAGLGRNFHMLQKEEDPLLKIYEALLEPSREKIVHAALIIIFGINVVRLLPLRLNKVFKELSQALDSQCMPMIDEKRRAIEDKADDHFDILSLLIKSGNFSDREMTDQLLTFLAAGHETTASSLSWACYLLSKHPDVQERLRDEVRRAVKMDALAEQNPDLSAVLEQLPLLNGVVQETLRLFPTVPSTVREAVRDTRVGEHMIPKGASVVLSMWLMNRSQHVWGPDSQEFKPERWINEDDGRPNQSGGAGTNYQFLTFLHGPRSCIGQSFARAELRCLIAALVGAFRWELDMDDELVVPQGVVTIKPANGLYLRMTALDDAKGR